MKRLVSVMILAGIPIACGTQVATTPDDATVAAQPESSSVASLGSMPMPICYPGGRSQVKAIGIVTVKQGKGWVTLRAVNISSDLVRQPCLDPSWSVSPDAGRDLSMPEHVTLYGMPGKYVVTATSALTVGRPLSATAVVIID